MGNKLTQLAIVVVFGLIIILGTLLVFQAWYGNTAPSEAEIQTVVLRATKMNVDDELAELNGTYNTSKSIETAGRVLMVIEAIVMVLLLVYVLMLPMAQRLEEEREEDGTMRRAYEGT